MAPAPRVRGSRPCCLWVIAVLLPATVAVAWGPQATPARVGLAPMAERIAHEDCRLLVIGDSNALKTSNHVLIGGICRTWEPDQFVGRVSPGAASSDEGIKIVSSFTGLDATARRMAHADTGDPDIWSNGQDGFLPNRGWDMVTTGTGLSSWATYCSAELTRLDEYPGGDWATGQSLRARLIFARGQSALPSMRYGARRGDDAGALVTFFPMDGAPETWIDWVECHVPGGAGPVSTQVRTPEGWTSENQGGPGPCPDNCEPGRTFYHGGQLIFRDDVEGLQVDAVAEAGFTVSDHLHPAGHYTDDAFSQYLRATRNPNLFLVLLGQNMTAAEAADVPGLWRENLVAMLDRCRAAALAAHHEADPMFVLVSPWSTDDQAERFGEMAQVMADIATTAPDVGFINLHLLAGSHAHLDGALLHDGIHCGSDAAADFMAAQLWNQIDRELDERADVVVAGSGADLSTLQLDHGSTLHIASGMHTGPLHVGEGQFLVRGWDRATCGIIAPDTSTAVHMHDWAQAEFRRLTLLGGGGVIRDGVRTGGAVHMDGLELYMYEVSINGGEADHGGAMAVHGELAVMYDVRIDGAAAKLGGGVYVDDGIMFLLNSAISNCAASEGGGVFTTGSASPEISDSTICGNLPDDITGKWTDLGGNAIGGDCACPTDLTGDGLTGVDDLLLVLAHFGQADEEGDTNGDGFTDVDDLLQVIQAWGDC